MSKLTINRSQMQGRQPVTILHLDGELDGSTESQLLDQARQAQEDGATHLLVNLSDCHMLTSAGLRAIQKILKLYTPQHDKEVIHEHRDEPYKSPYFKMVCPNPQVYYVLNIAGFLQNLLIYNNMEDAIDSFTS